MKLGPLKVVVASRELPPFAVEAVVEEPVEASGKTIGCLTRMDALQVQAMTQMSRHQLDIRLKQIEASLTEWEAGKYGVCRHCRGSIGVKRLEALPEAPFCLACQESFEV